MTETAAIRAATDHDRPAIAAFHADSWRDAYQGMLPDDYLAGPVNDDLLTKWNSREITDRDVLLIAEQASHFVGFIAVWCQPDPFVDNLHVKPSLRSSGLGTSLMARAAETLLADGHSTMTLDVFTSNKRAISFYERLGGQQGHREIKELFGNPVELVTIGWTDLTTILKAAS